MRTPSRNKADPAKEFPKTLKMLDKKIGSPSENTTRPSTPSKVIRRIGFMKIDRIVCTTTKHFPRKILLLLFVSVEV